MSIEIEMTGSGTLGPIAPNWNVQEFATPNSIGDTAGGAGSVSFTAHSTVDSLLVVNNNITTTHETLGSIDGIVGNVSQQGLASSITHSNGFNIYDSEKIIPPIKSGSVFSALDVCESLLRNRLTVSGYSFSSFSGHAVAFETDSTSGAFNYSASSFNPVSFVSALDDNLNYQQYSTYCEGGYLPNWYESTEQTLMYFKVLSSQTVSVYFGRYNGIDFDVINFGLASGYIYIEANGTYVSAPFGSIGAGEVVFGILWSPATNTLSVGVSKINGSGVYVSLNLIGSSYNASNLYINGYIRSLIEKNITWTGSNPTNITPWTSSDYEVTQSFYSPITIPLYNPVPSVRMTMWEYIQSACSATGQEVKLVDNLIKVSDVGTSVISIDNLQAPPSISTSSAFSAKSIDIEYSNSAYVAPGEIYNGSVIYDAYEDNNNVLEVNVGEIKKITLQSSCSALSIFAQPILRISVPNADGCYIVTDSTGLVVGGTGVATAWYDYGASLDVVLSTEVPGGIDVTLVGPVSDIPGYTAPYKIAYSSGYETYAALSILGTGVSYNNQTLSLQTGVDVSKTSKSKAANITNPFIATIEQAYDRGIWASQVASGPNLSFNITVPTRDIARFGVTPGSIISYGEAKYRVTDVSINNISTSINAIYHVTVEDFDGNVSGLTVAQYDTIVSGMQTQDSIVKALV